MARYCLVCLHPQRLEIDSDLMRGATLEAVCQKYPGLSRSGIARHRKDHLGQFELILGDDNKIREIIENTRNSVVERLQGPKRFEDRLSELRVKIDGLLDQAEREKDQRLMLAALREARNLLDLEAKIILSLLGLKSESENHLTVKYEGV